MLVISDYDFNTRRLDQRSTSASSERGGRARPRTRALATGVAGGAAQLNDYGARHQRGPLVVAAIAARHLPGPRRRSCARRSLAAIAVGLNLATVGVAFGVLTLLFNVPAGYPLGGHTYVDTVGAAMIFGVIFGLSIDYAVFLLTRMRERYDARRRQRRRRSTSASRRPPG